MEACADPARSRTTQWKSSLKRTVLYRETLIRFHVGVPRVHTCWGLKYVAALLT